MSRAMKDSGIPWIGEIPSHWRTERIKTIFSERTELSEDGTEDLLSVSEYYGVDKRAGRVEEGDFVSRSESLVGYKKCYKGDFVSNIMLAWKGSLGVSDYDGVVSPAYCVYKPSESVYPKYYHYLFRTSLYTGRFRCFSKGIIDSRLRLYSPYFFDIEAIIPPKEEQQSIADFLDKKCGEIDEMVSLQEKIVEELKAYKQSVITEAVCKGLNPDVPMKDSGIEWIGQIPEGWKVSRVGLHYSIILGKMLCDKPIEGGALVPYFCAANVHFDGIGAEELKRMWFSKEEQEKYRVQVGDLLVVEGGAGAGGCAIVHNLSHNTFIQNSIMIVRSVSHDCRFLKYLLERLVKQGYVDYVCNKATIPHFTKDKLSQVPYAFPSREEQQDIADYLDTKCTVINILISVRQAKIEALKEYKKSIIYEYITGKKEING